MIQELIIVATISSIIAGGVLYVVSQMLKAERVASKTESVHPTRQRRQ